MSRSLHEIVGLPATMSKAELSCAVEARMDAIFSKAANGDTSAQQELAELRFAYLLWAYAAQETSCSAATLAYGGQERAQATLGRLMPRSFPASAGPQLHP